MIRLGTGYRWEAERSDEVMRARQEMRDEREMKTNNYHTLRYSLFTPSLRLAG